MNSNIYTLCRLNTGKTIKCNSLIRENNYIKLIAAAHVHITTDYDYECGYCHHALLAFIMLVSN